MQEGRQSPKPKSSEKKAGATLQDNLKQPKLAQSPFAPILMSPRSRDLSLPWFSLASQCHWRQL